MHTESMLNRLATPKAQELLERIRLNLVLKSLREDFKAEVVKRLSKSINLFKELPKVKNPVYTDLNNKELQKHQNNRLIAATIRIRRNYYKIS